MTVRTPVYLDHHATTPVDPRVVDAMLPVLREHFGNPSSASHAHGWAAAALVDRAREHVAALVGCEAREIVFTSGATESIDLALRGTLAGREPGHLVTTVLEHDAVREPMAALEAAGWEVARVRCGADGLTDPADVAAALRPDTVLVSMIAAHNEVGTVQPLAEVGTLCKERGVLFHTDAAQAVGRIPVDVGAAGVDLLGLSAHKFHGPKGVGALYVRSREPRVRPEPRLLGGGQEGGLRSGTLNVPGIVGLGEACRLAKLEGEERAERLRAMSGRFYATVADAVPAVRLIGAAKPRLPGSLCLAVPGVSAADLAAALPTLSFSTGSACGSGRPGPSPSLLAMGCDKATASSAVRIALGKDTTDDEAAYAASRLAEAFRNLSS